MRFARSLAISLSCLIALGGSEAHAVLPTGWTSVRALGMGNAYTAVVDDVDAVMYNPAMLMKIGGVHWRIINPRVGLDNPTQLQSLSGISSVSGLMGKNFWAGGGAMTGITLPYLAAVGYGNAELGAAVLNPTYAKLDLDYFIDYGVGASVLMPLIPEIFGLGLTVRTINRTGLRKVVGPMTLATGDDAALEAELKRNGTAIGVDLGAVLTIPGPLSPTLSFVYRDVGTTNFSALGGAGSPPPVVSEMIAGGSVVFKLPFFSITPAIDYRYIGWSGLATGMNVNAGVEVSLLFLDVRAGVSQGYYTAGVGLDLGLISADVATWAVEMGAYPGQKVDRRYMLQATLEIGFDPGSFLGGFGSRSSGGGSSGSSAPARRLKQRR